MTPPGGFSPDLAGEARAAFADAARYLRQREELGEPCITDDPPARAHAAPEAVFGAMAHSDSPVTSESPRAVASHAPAEPVASSASARTVNLARLPERVDATRMTALRELAEVARTCTKCSLAPTRTNVVFGVGSCRSGIFFIGEAPGADEDAQGEPFVGRAGQLLTRAITQGLGLTRDDVYIANVVKCRPPANRVPHPTEAAECMPYLVKQIALLQPAVICALGLTAARHLLDTRSPMGSLRGREHAWHGVPVVVTYHPAAILRTPEYKRSFWEDLQTVMRMAGLATP